MRLARVWEDPRKVVAAVVLTGYVGIALALQNFYPFSVFDMYSRRAATASRIVARSERGDVVEVERFDGWRCEGALDAAPPKCGEPGSFSYTPYLDAELLGYVTAHTAPPGGGEGGERVEILRRIWWLDAPGAPRTTDCVLQTCRAVRR